MALNDDEKKLLAELQERANAPEEDDDFEIEVYDTNAGKGARIPYRQGKSWLHSTFGIGSAPAPAEGGEGGEGGESATQVPAGGKAYFGRKK